MRFDIITIFPKIFNSYLSESILKRAQKKKLVTIRSHDIRKFSRDKHKKVDNKPYGGGAGMVLAAEPILRAVGDVLKKRKNHPVIRQGRYPMGSETSSDDRAKIKITNKKVKIILLSAKGKQFTQKMAYEWAKKYDQLVLISGRYEGIDERVKIALSDLSKKNVVYNSDSAYRRQSSRAASAPAPVISFEEISIGPYVLTDGDAAAMVIVSAVARLIPDVIKRESLEEESFSTKLKAKSWKLKPARRARPNASGGQAGGAALAEYPHYTRPEVFVWKGKTYRVPKVLLSGDHKKIAAWRRDRMK